MHGLFTRFNLSTLVIMGDLFYTYDKSESNLLCPFLDIQDSSITRLIPSQNRYKLKFKKGEVLVF